MRSIRTSSDIAISVEQNKLLSQNYRYIIGAEYLPTIMENPLYGIGHGNFNQLLFSKSYLWNNSHNILFGVVIEYGIISGILFIVLIIMPIKRLIFLIGMISSKSERLSIGILLAIIFGILFHGMFHENLINMNLWLFLVLGQSVLINMSYKKVNQPRNI